MKELFNKVTIVGVGLIGGSLGLAIKKNKLAGVIWGLVRREDSILQSERMKAVDIATLNIKEAITDSDLIILSTPTQIILEYLEKIAPFLKKNSIIIDVGSTKKSIVEKAQNILPKQAHFIGSHPLAGSEKKGVEFAGADLFDDSLCVITPLQSQGKQSIKRIKTLWQKIGAKPVVLTPDEHDEIISFVSHLPHVLTFLLMDTIPEEFFKFSSSGLKSMTRIAGSDPYVWRDILVTNKRNILKSIESFTKKLQLFQSLIEKESQDAIVEVLTRIKKKKEALDDYRN